MIYIQLFLVYLKIGFFGFGGGYAMLSLIHDEIVSNHHWLTGQEFTDIIAISQVTPGPIGINSATYIGYSVTGNIWGSVLATFAVSIPSFLLVLLICISYKKFRSNRVVEAAFIGIRPATVGLIAAAALLLAIHPDFIRRIVYANHIGLHDVFIAENFLNWKSVFIFSVTFYVILKKIVHPILMIVLAAIAGYLLF